MGVGKGGRGQGRAMPPWIFTHSLLNLPNFKNSFILVVDTGSILIGPLLKNFLPTPLAIHFDILEFCKKNLVFEKKSANLFVNRKKGLDLLL